MYPPLALLTVPEIKAFILSCDDTFLMHLDSSATALGFFGHDVIAGLPLVINIYIPFSLHIQILPYPQYCIPCPPSPLEEIL